MMVPTYPVRVNDMHISGWILNALKELNIDGMWFSFAEMNERFEIMSKKISLDERLDLLRETLDRFQERMEKDITYLQILRPLADKSLDAICQIILDINGVGEVKPQLEQKMEACKFFWTSQPSNLTLSKRY